MKSWKLFWIRGNPSWIRAKLLGRYVRTAIKAFKYISKSVEVALLKYEPYMIEDCLEITEWETPATKYPLIKAGSVEISRINQKAGYYYIEGVRGYDSIITPRKSL